MAKGSGIVVKTRSNEQMFNGYVSGTPSPGTIMQIAAATEPVGGLYTYEVYNRDASGNRPQGPLVVLDIDHGAGKSTADAYVTGTLGYFWYVLPGDEFNLRVTASGTGTGDAQAIADLYIVEDATGLLIATTGSPESEPFMCMETVSDVVAAGTLVHVVATGY